MAGGEVLIGGEEQAAARAAETLAAAHQALKADPATQFTLGMAGPPPGPPKWLLALLDAIADVFRPIGSALRWIGNLMPDAPYARLLLWTVLAVIALAVLAMAYHQLRHGDWRFPFRRKAAAVVAEAEEEQWQPEAAPVRSWLREADMLALQGRFAEAVHLLLFRSIEDIARRRPQIVRPALTSREIAAAEAIPPAARGLFERIALLVERSLFGGRDVDAREWQAARAAYADFVLPKAWSA